MVETVKVSGPLVPLDGGTSAPTRTVVNRTASTTPAANRNNTGTRPEGVTRMDARQLLIKHQAEAFDVHKDLQRMTSKEAFVNQSLIDADMAPLKPGELAMGADDVRAATIAAAVKEYNASPDVRRMTSCRAHVVQALVDQGLEPALTSKEGQMVMSTT